MSPKKILVTGGAGFIGSHLTDYLVKRGHKLLVIDDLSGGYRRNVHPEVEFSKIDLRDHQKTERKIKRFKPEIIYHLAANAAENKAQFSPIDITSRNYDTFRSVLVAGLKNGLRRIVVTSSIAVYGALQTPFKETDKPEPEDLYGLSKLKMEETLKILSRVHNFEWVVTRPHNVYGPRQNMADPYRNVVTIFMNSLLRNQPYHIYGDGEQRRCFSYINEVVEAIAKCGFLDVSGMIFNIGSDKHYSLNELSKVIQQVAKKVIPPKFLEDRPQEVKVAIADHRLAKKYLRYQDKTPLLKGIRATWRYASQLGPQIPIFTGVELPHPKLPKNWQV